MASEVYDRSELLRLQRACDRRTPTGARNRALLGFLFGSGLRISEALALLPGDLDLHRGQAHVRCGKGGKERRAGILSFADEDLRSWLERRDRMAGGWRHSAALSPVFCTRSGGAIDPSYVRHMLPRLARKAGILRRVHAHGFRHSHAVTLEEAGVGLRDIAGQLGHARLSTTDTYVGHLTGRAARVVRGVA